MYYVKMLNIFLKLSSFVCDKLCKCGSDCVQMGISYFGHLNNVNVPEISGV